MSDTRNAIVNAAFHEIGPQTKGSAIVYGYWRDVLPPSETDAQVKAYAKVTEWCGGFALWCIRQAGVAQGLRWTIGLGFVGPARLPHTTTPQAGDVMIQPSPFWHHAIVEKCESAIVYVRDAQGHDTPRAAYKLTTIDGNQPDVRRRSRTVLASAVTFYSIAPLLGETSALAPAFPVLRTGSSDRTSVTALQAALNVHGARPPLVTDGSFGPATEKALRAFQTQYSLVSDGVCGAHTWEALTDLKS